MVDGRLVALDTPAGLKAAHVPGRFIAVESAAGPAAARAALDGLPGVLGVQTFGRRLRVRLAADASDDALRGRLVAAGLPTPTIEAGDATLEDVFLELVRRAEPGEVAA